MKKLSFLSSMILVIALVVSASVMRAKAEVPLAVDRGLPTANLNNDAGSNRSNVAWSADNDYITGDTFKLGDTGDVWRVTAIRTWSITDHNDSAVLYLGDIFKNVTLYGARQDAPLTQLLAGNLSTGSDTNSNPNITHTRVTYANGMDYQGTSGTFRQLWQHDFNNLNWIVRGGQNLYFAVDGELQDSVSYYWFNHASNAALSGSPQDDSDNLYYAWAKNDLATPYSCDSFGTATGVCNGGWDKSSDINVQVWAEKLPPPMTVYVNLSWAGTAFGTDPDGSGPATIFGYDAFAGIQDGIGGVAAGGTVIVATGTYAENVTIGKALTLQGAGQNAAFINGINSGSNASTVLITASGDVTVTGFTITNAPTNDATDLRFGVLTNSPIPAVTYTITENKVVGTNGVDNEQDYGIYGQNGGKENLVITHNVVTQTGANNIVIEAHQGTTEISDNTLDAGSYGVDAIFIMTHSGVDVSSKQTVRNNTIDMSTGTGSSSATGISFATVAGTYGVQPAKFLVGSIEINSNTIVNLKENRRGIGFWNDSGEGEGSAGEISSPLVINNEVTALAGNPVNSMGIDTIGQVSAAQITNNDIKGVNFCYKERLWNGHIAAGTLLNQNSFVDCVGGVVTERVTGTLDAAQNWWGSQHGPTSAANPGGDGQPVSENVTFNPWLCDGTDTQPAVVGFQPAAGQMCTATPTRLAFITQPGNAYANQSLGTQPVVEAQDAGGNLAVNFTGNVALSLKDNPAGVTLKGTTTVAAIAGVATFTDLAVDKPGNGYILDASATSPALNGLSNPFDILPYLLYMPVIRR